MSLAVYAELQCCQLIFAIIKQFFLMFSKLLYKDKLFLLENMEKYLCLYFF